MRLVVSDTSGKQGVIQQCETNCSLGDAAISNNAGRLAEFIRSSNRWLSVVWTWIFFSYGGIQFDDSNQTDLPFSSDTLTSGKRVYANPTGMEAVKAVAFKDAGGNYVPLAPITHEQILQRGYTIDSFMSTNGTPRYYMPVGESIYCFPPSDTTRASGWKVYQDRGAVSFAVGDTTAKAPGFSAQFHEIIPTGASVDWLAINKPDSKTLTKLMNDLVDYENRLKKFYRQKFEQLYPPRVTVRDATQDAM